MTADLRHHREAQLVHKAAHARDHGRIAKEGDLRLVDLEHHAVHAILHDLHGTLFQSGAQGGGDHAPNLLPDFFQPGQRPGIAVGRTQQEGRAALLGQDTGGRNGFLPQHQIDLGTAHLLDLLHTGVQTQAGVQLHAEGLPHQTLDLPHIAFHAEEASGRAKNVVRSGLAGNVRFGNVLRQQAICRLNAHAVVAPKAALLKGDQTGVDLLLHVGANALQVGADDCRYRGGHHEDHPRMIPLIHLHQRLFQPGDVAHHHVVLTHVGGEQTVLLIHAQLAEQAHAEMRGAGGAVFHNYAVFDG